jgi:catechol 2,3-dioxygenase-like lactoylglutathione lyase family enzyme
MLASAHLVAFAATLDAALARTFYRDTLGLRLVSEDAFALVFDCNGTVLRIQLVEKLVTPPYTSLGWLVPDIETTARDLHRSGVALERFPGMDQDELGIWKSPTGARVGWFKDPSGNTLSITSFKPASEP